MLHSPLDGICFLKGGGSRSWHGKRVRNQQLETLGHIIHMHLVRRVKKMFQDLSRIILESWCNCLPAGRNFQIRTCWLPYRLTVPRWLLLEQKYFCSGWKYRNNRHNSSNNVGVIQSVHMKVHAVFCCWTFLKLFIKPHFYLIILSSEEAWRSFLCWY